MSIESLIISFDYTIYIRLRSLILSMILMPQSKIDKIIKVYDEYVIIGNYNNLNAYLRKNYHVINLDRFGEIEKKRHEIIKVGEVYFDIDNTLKKTD